MQDCTDIGPHYAVTLRAWRAAWEEQHRAILKLGYSERFWRKYRCVWAVFVKYLTCSHSVFLQLQVVFSSTCAFALIFLSVIKLGMLNVYRKNILTAHCWGCSLLEGGMSSMPA